MSPLLFESICVKDGAVQLLPYHQARVNRALVAGAHFSLEECIAGMDIPSLGRHKLRITYSQQGEVLEKNCDAYTPRRISRLVFRECPELRYEHKWEDRSALRDAASGLSLDEELIITQQGYLCEASYANILLGEEGAWFTPSRCLLAGVKRQFLLDSGEVQLRDIHISDLRYYKNLCLINAMLDVGEICLKGSSRNSFSA